MVCAVCSIERRENGELKILDYPRFLAADIPCPNCGSGAPREKPSILKEFAKAAIERRRASGDELQGSMLTALSAAD